MKTLEIRWYNPATDDYSKVKSFNDVSNLDIQPSVDDTLIIYIKRYSDPR